jgi:hypothetical protein
MTEMLFTTTPETTADAAKLDVIEFKVSHKHGALKGFGVKMFDARVVVKKMNKHWIEAYGADKSYLVNDWQIGTWDADGKHIDPETSGKITYVRTLKMARELAAKKVLAGVAAGVPARA